MRIVVEVTHPAHVHFYRNPIRILKEQGHEVAVTSRDKDCTLALLDELSIPHKCLTVVGRGGISSMFSELVKRNLYLYRVLKNFKADLVTGVGGTSAAQAGFIAGCPSVIFYNTEQATLQNIITYPFASHVVVSESYTGWTPRKRTLRYQGYHELSCLHPKYFRPSKSVALANGLSEHGPTFLIRLVSWQATHDIGLKGWDRETLRDVIERLKKNGRVIISSETNLPAEFDTYRYSGDQSALHHVMGYCRLVLGESATMSSEAIAMGVPAIYAAPSYRGYITEQQCRYGMASFVPEPSARNIIPEIDYFLSLTKDELRNRHRELLTNCIDVPEFIATTLIESVT